MTTTAPAPDEATAYAWCRAYARGRQENFTVVSWFLPRRLRPHFFAVYAFCRWTDDLGDEAPGGPSTALRTGPSTALRASRLAQLDYLERALEDCYAGRRPTPLFVALGLTIDTFSIPADLFRRLIEANRIDQRQSRFETYADLLNYCEHSATPVGRIVLHLLGYRDEERGRLADATCVGLQLANFWQDVTVDREKGRLYLPIEDIRRFGYSEAELRAGVVNEAFRHLIEFEVGRARELFDEGKRLEERVDRAVRTDVRLFLLGGVAVLDAIERAGYDVLSRRPRVGRARKAMLALSTGLRLKAGR